MTIFGRRRNSLILVDRSELPLSYSLVNLMTLNGRPACPVDLYVAQQRSTRVARRVLDGDRARGRVRTDGSEGGSGEGHDAERLGWT